MSTHIIGQQGITVQSILAIALENYEELESVVVVGMRKEGGTIISCSMSMAELALARIVILEHLLAVRK